MTYRPNYVPKNKRKLNYKVIVPLVVLFALSVYFIGNIFFQSKEPAVKGFAICDMNDYNSRKLIRERQTHYESLGFLPVRDYGVYGESLSLYENAYTYTSVDPMIGRTLTLTNLCDSKQENTFLLSAELDMRILMESLSDGFYEIDVLADLKHYALVSEGIINDSFSTVSKDGKVKQVTVHADASLFDLDDDKVLSKNYVFLEVKTVDATANEFDIIIDPNGGSLLSNGNIDLGSQHNGLVEMDEMYTAAEGIKAILESYGLRVHVARDNTTPKNIYGAEGRISDAYKYNAKYYIQLSFETSGSSMDKGIMSLYSSYASNRFSTNIVKSLTSKTTLQTTPYNDGSNMNGVYQTGKSAGYDYNDLVRETGGKFTGAGYAESYFNGIHDFAKDSRRSMYGITLLYGYMTDSKDFEVWNNEKEAIIKATAEGILAQLNIKLQGE